MRFDLTHRNQDCPGDAGFTLVEMMVTILLLGLLFAFAVPTVQTMSGAYKLKGATENLAGQIRLGRDRALATGVNQHFHFTPFSGADYFIIDHSTGNIPSRWNLPKGITYFTGAGTIGWVDMKIDGRASFSGLIILQDQRGLRDTVSIQTSGLVLTK